MLSLPIGDETLIPLPERALFWQRTRTLFIAGAGDSTDTARLHQAMRTTDAAKVIFVGEVSEVLRGSVELPVFVIGPDDPPTPGPYFVLHTAPVVPAAGYALVGSLAGGRTPVFEGMPCFWFGTRWAVLPAFGEALPPQEIQPAAGDRVLTITDGIVQERHA